jgi:hypothetical protein
MRWLYRETLCELDRYQVCANEGRSLDEAVSFARYVLWSGLDKVLSPYDCKGAYPVDSSHLRWKAEELQRTVHEQFAAGRPRGAEPSLEAIHRKLDILAAHISKTVPEANCVTLSSKRREPHGPRQRDGGSGRVGG